MIAASNSLLLALFLTGGSDTPVPSGDTGTERAALYGALAAIVVAVLTSVTTIVVQRMNARRTPTSEAAPRSSTRQAAYERWFLLQGYDPRKIRTGYEAPEEVRVEHTSG